MENSSSVNNLHFSSRPSFLVPTRIDAPELLELGVGSAQDVEANFADMWRINHYLGGLSALTSHLYPRLTAYKQPSTVVDVGTGSADFLPVIRQWAHEHQVDLKLWGLDFSARNLAVAHHSSSLQKNLIQADALHLPFREGSVDYFVSSLFLHHLSPEQVITLLARTFKAASRGIIMSDLVRGWLPMVAFKLGQPIFARNFLTRIDGITSIRRAYTPDELRQLAQAAGLTNAQICLHPLWRMTLVAEK